MLVPGAALEIELPEEVQIKVAVAGDLTSTIDYLSQLLDREGEIVIAMTAENWLDAVQRFSREKPDVILMDVNMADVDGIEATRYLTDTLPGIPVVIMSDKDDLDTVRRAMEAGARDYLLTPIEVEDLEETIKRVYHFERRKEAFAQAPEEPPGFDSLGRVPATGVSGEEKVAPRYDASVHAEGGLLPALEPEAEWGEVEAAPGAVDETPEDDIPAPTPLAPSAGEEGVHADVEPPPIVEGDERATGTGDDGAGTQEPQEEAGEQEPEAAAPPSVSEPVTGDEAAAEKPARRWFPDEPAAPESEPAEDNGASPPDWWAENVIGVDKPDLEEEAPAPVLPAGDTPDWWGQNVGEEEEAPPEPASAVAPAPAPAPPAPAVPVEVKREEAPYQPPYQPVAPPLKGHGEIVVLFSGKGGVGTSIISANLACSLAKELGAKVALVDLDLQSGDQGAYLELEGRGTIFDLAQHVNGLDPAYVQEVMSTGPVPGLRVLEIPGEQEMADTLYDAPGHVDRILTELRTIYDYIIVDTSSHLNDVILNALEMASRVVVVSSYGVASISSTSRIFRTLDEKLSLDMGKVMLVMNEVDPHHVFNKVDVENRLKWKVAVSLPNAGKVVSESITAKTPFVLSAPQLDVSKKIRELAGLLVPGGTLASMAEPKQPKPRRFFGRR